MHTKNAWVSLIGVILLVAIIITAVIVARPTNEPVMLTVQAINKDAGNDSEDYWAGSMQTVYYNGDVEYYDEFSQSGKKNKEKWNLDTDTVINLQALLKTIDYFQNETLTSGIQHKITYYNTDGTVLLEYYGSIEGNTFSRIVYQIAK